MDKAERDWCADKLVEKYEKELANDDFRTIIKDLAKPYEWVDHGFDQTNKILFTALYEIIPECINNALSWDICKLTQHNKSLESFKIPKKWDTIDDDAFIASSIKNIEIEEGIRKIGGRAFYGCSNLTDIILPDSITEINNNGPYGMVSGAFQYCYNLKNVKMPNNLKILKSWTFAGCTALTTITLPNVMRIEVNAFNQCTALKDIIVENPDAYFATDGFIEISHPFMRCDLNQLTVHARSERIKYFCKNYNIKYIDLDSGEQFYG